MEKIDNTQDEEFCITQDYVQEYFEAYKKSVKYLGIRARTENEMREYLTKKSYDEIITEQVISKLKEYRYINDVEFCRLYFNSYKNRTGYKKIMSDLAQRGVSRYDIADAVALMEDAEEMGSQAETVIYAAEKYIRTHSKADKNKLYAFLQSKGFNYSDIRKAMDIVINQLNKDDKDNKGDIDYE